MGEYPRHDNYNEDSVCPSCHHTWAVKCIDSNSGMVDSGVHIYDYNRYKCENCGYIFEKRWYE
jgi:rubredoxin